MHWTQPNKLCCWYSLLHSGHLFAFSEDTYLIYKKTGKAINTIEFRTARTLKNLLIATSSIGNRFHFSCLVGKMSSPQSLLTFLRMFRIFVGCRINFLILSKSWGVLIGRWQCLCSQTIFANAWIFLSFLSDNISRSSPFELLKETIICFFSSIPTL